MNRLLLSKYVLHAQLVERLSENQKVVAFSAQDLLVFCLLFQAALIPRVNVPHTVQASREAAQAGQGTNTASPSPSATCRVATADSATPAAARGRQPGL